MESSTVAAIATALIPSGIGVIRVSGPESLKVLLQLTGKKEDYFAPRLLKVVRIYSRSGELMEKGLAVYMPAPHSYTGEDVVEFHCHGSPPILEAVLKEILSMGVSLAGPGEFTKRAFLNKKLDLSQAEAVLALVNAPNFFTAKAALSQLEGALSFELRSIEGKLTSLLALIEGALDFPEDVELGEQELELGLGEVLRDIELTLSRAESGERARKPPKLVIAGKPNVGKSSLLNVLLGEERAIVTPIPGTTRDSVEEEVSLNGVRMRLVDTAGLGKVRGVLDFAGQKRTRDLLEQADLILLLVDISSPFTSEDQEIWESLRDKKVLLVGNKCDLGENGQWALFPEAPALKVSALTKEGIPQLIELLSQEGKKFLPSRAELWYLSLRQKEALSVSRET
ncbi:MAG: tRNA uridine-5-carboxymethylaminomethyl(34) synthesis GTPase MnmE, partial [bacterium]